MQAPNRFVRRAMEKENSKSREDSRKQYNSTVLRLVTLCKKTDPRYTEAIEAEKKERERKEEEARKRQQEAELRRKEELRSKMETGVTKVCLSKRNVMKRLKMLREPSPSMILYMRRLGPAIYMSA